MAAGAAEPKVVEEVFTGFAGVYNLHLVGGAVIGTTAEHPFFAVGRGWTPTNQLHPGDRLVCADGTTATVEEVLDTGDWVPVYNLRVADHHTYFVGGDEWGFSVWSHNACVILYRYVKGGDPEQLRHWSIEVQAENDSYNADLKNDTDGHPGEGASVNDWVQWAKKSKPDAWTRKLRDPGKVQNIGLDDVKQWEISEPLATAAIQVLKDLFTQSNPQNKTWTWNLYGMSCFEFVAKVLRVALPGAGIPGTPNNNDTMQKLIDKLTVLVKS